MEATMMDSDELVQSGDASISCYVGEIPPFVEAELARSYETLHASLPFFKVFKSIEQANCYVARRDGHPSTVLLFTCHNRRVEVLNEMIELEQAELDRFVRYVFEKFERADVIIFKAVKAVSDKLGLPVQRHHSKDTYVISLPATPEDYTNSLGSKTRADIRHQTRKVLKDFPSFTSKFLVNEEIDEQYVRKIIELSERKINATGVKLFRDVDRIIALAKMCGFVNVLLIDGQVCAGSINYRIGSSCFGDITSYDLAYEKYSMGRLCIHHAISESIIRGGTKFYLGGGVFEFKQRMLGTLLSMDELRIYRSYWKMLVNADRAAEAVMRASVGSLKRILHQHKQKMWAKLVFKSFHYFKNRLAKP
jgi:hypothetical protein